MKKAIMLVAVLVVVIGASMVFADGSTSESSITVVNVGQIGLYHVDPGEGGTDCTFLNHTTYYNWQQIKEWRGGHLCEGMYHCKRAAAWLGLTSVTGWAIPRPEAKAIAAAGFATAVAGGQICAWVETLSCEPEDRYIVVGKKRKYKVFEGEEYTPGRCRAKLVETDWEEIYFK